jgi:hypothetical protein
MGKLDEIRNKLRSGATTGQLITQGYPRSSVYRENKKLKVIQTGTPASPVSDEIQELRRHKEIIKLQKEIADLELAKEKIPDKVAALEKSVDKLRSLLNNAVDTALYTSLFHAGMDQEEARELADGWVEQNTKG